MQFGCKLLQTMRNQESMYAAVTLLKDVDA